MKMSFFRLADHVELRPRADSGGSGTPVSFRDARDAKRTLQTLLAQDKRLHRLRAFLSWSLMAQGMERRTDSEVLDQAAQALCSGRLLLASSPIRSRAPGASAPRREESRDAEEWVEIAPEPTPAEAEPESFAVSHESASALAESNRELAASGAPFKEICANTRDCPVCNAQLAVMAD
jgi:hypothetical protein